MNIINSLKIGIIIVISLGLFACNSKSTYDNQPRAAVPLIPIGPISGTVLEGTWIYKKCSRVSDTDPQKLYFLYVDKIATYTKNKIQVTTRWYDDPYRLKQIFACVLPIITTKITRDFKFGDIIDPGSKDEHTNIDKTVNKVLVTIHSVDVVYRVNREMSTMFPENFGFGITNWVQNVEKDVTNNKLAIKFYDIGLPKLDIFNISNQKLFEGDQDGDKDSDGRPLTLDVHYWATHQ